VNLPDLGILALIEGVADVIPIDASAHIQLATRLLGWRAGPLAAVLHLGTALAIMSYLWRDMAQIGIGLWRLRKARLEPGTRLLGKILLAAAPLLVALGGVGGFQAPRITNLFALGVITLFCALIMLFADRLSLTVKRIEHIGLGTTLAVSLVQLCSLVPGVGRVAAALIAARLFGMERQDAYRFILLVSLPILLGEALMEFAQNQAAHKQAGLSDLLAGLITYCLVLFVLPIAFSLIRRAGLLPFAVYRLLFGAMLVALGMI
jgi:undecaprenyl-diphosphatase